MEKIILTSERELDTLIQRSLRKVLEDDSLKINTEGSSDSILSVQEAADFLNLAQQTLYGFTSKRLIPFMKRGKRLYFSRTELEKWLAEGKRKTVAEI